MFLCVIVKKKKITVKWNVSVSCITVIKINTEIRCELKELVCVLWDPLHKLKVTWINWRQTEGKR